LSRHTKKPLHGKSLILFFTSLLTDIAKGSFSYYHNSESFIKQQIADLRNRWIPWADPGKPIAKYPVIFRVFYI
jgi:hypothetical protein